MIPESLYPQVREAVLKHAKTRAALPEDTRALTFALPAGNLYDFYDPHSPELVSTVSVTYSDLLRIIAELSAPKTSNGFTVEFHPSPCWHPPTKPKPKPAPVFRSARREVALDLD